MPSTRSTGTNVELSFAYLHEEDVSCGISAGVYNKCLLLDVTASTGPDGELTAVLKT